MSIVLWIVQSLLALAFLAAGSMKLMRSKAQLEEQMPWVTDFSPMVIRLIGAVEVLGALGLILPAVTGIATVLTPLAATGLAVVMVGAMVTHVRRNEMAQLAPNVVLLALALFVAWGRFGPYSL